MPQGVSAWWDARGVPWAQGAVRDLDLILGEAGSPWKGWIQL